MSVDSTSFDAFLQKYYVKDRRFELLNIYDKPLFGLVSKNPKWNGDSLEWPIHVNAPGAPTGDYATAKANAVSGDDIRFSATDAELYDFTTISHKVIKQSRMAPGAGAFENVLEKVKSLNERFRGHLAYQLYRSKGGSIGQVETVTNGSGNTATLKLVDENDAMFLGDGQKVVFAGTSTGGSPIVGTTGSISIIDKDAGTFTVTSGSNQTPVTANSYVFTEGAVNVAGAGLGTWLPDDSPTDTLFGVNRANYPTVTGGLRLDASGLGKWEALIRAGAKCSRFGAKVQSCFMNPEDWAELQVEMSDNVQFQIVAGKGLSGNTFNPAVLGFKGIVVMTAAGPVTCYSDPHCPKNRAYMIDLNQFMLFSLDTAPHVQSEDGLKMLRDANGNYEHALIAHWQLRCRAPQLAGCVIKFS